MGMRYRGATSLGAGHRFAKAGHERLYAPPPPRAALTECPLTDSERQAVAERIQREVSETAIGIVREEQETRERLNTTHVKCISLLVLALVAIGFCMVYLRVVLVPFILAIFFMFLLEPLLFAILNPPAIFQRACPRLKSLAQHMEQARLRNTGQATPGDGANADSGCADTGQQVLQTLIWKIWSSLAVAICLMVLFSTSALVIYLIVQAITEFHWTKYVASPRMRLVLQWFPHFGRDPADLSIEGMIPWLLQGPVFDALDITFSVLSQAFLTVLFLAFLLANDATIGEHEDFLGIGKRIRTSVRRYIRIKSLMAFVVAFLSGLVYWQAGVELCFLFAFITFLLCYIPHVGNTIAILAPLPLVFLDPSKTWADLLVVFGLPCVFHHLSINLVEPKLLANSLDLHPIIVLLVIAFWTTVWGAVGAVLSVPVTAVLRQLLRDVDHPYAQPIFLVLKGKVRDLATPARQNSVGSTATSGALRTPTSNGRIPLRVDDDAAGDEYEQVAPSKSPSRMSPTSEASTLPHQKCFSSPQRRPPTGSPASPAKCFRGTGAAPPPKPLAEPRHLKCCAGLW